MSSVRRAMSNLSSEGTNTAVHSALHHIEVKARETVSRWPKTANTHKPKHPTPADYKCALISLRHTRLPHLIISKAHRP